MTLQLTKNTIDILKNFANINQGIVVPKGSKLRTMAVAKNIMAEAQIDEEFPQTFAIYDLNEFLATLSLFKEPILTFGEKSVVIGDKNTRSKATYFYSSPDVIISPGDKKLVLPSNDVSFELSAENMSAILKACSILQAPDMVVRGSGKILELVATDLSNDSSNTYAITLSDDYQGVECEYVIKAERMKMINEVYDVVISKIGMAHFTSKAGDLQYWIALEKNSKSA